MGTATYRADVRINVKIFFFLDHDVLVENTEMQNSFRQVSSNLKEILKHPGVWDPFILSYVEVRTNKLLKPNKK